MTETTQDVRAAARDLSNRLRGKYAVGPILANGEPEFGYRVFSDVLGKPFPAIHGEAADMIDTPLDALAKIKEADHD